VRKEIILICLPHLGQVKGLTSKTFRYGLGGLLIVSGKEADLRTALAQKLLFSGCESGV